MAILGIDISKEFFDATLIDDMEQSYHRQFQNKVTGFEQLQNWLQKYQISNLHVCMEATNIYWEDLAYFLHKQGYQVSVVNPARIKGFAQSQLNRNKTDKLDSQLIATFCKLIKPKLWTPPTPEQKRLRALVRHLQTLKKDLTQHTNRLRDAQDQMVKESLEAIIQMLNTQISSIEQQIEQFIDTHPDLKQKRDLLMTIKGIGAKTATIIIAEMHDLAEYDNARAVAADAGLTPSHHISGTSVKRRPKISKIGKSSVRGALYLPAMTAIRYNPIISAFKERLLKRGKAVKVIIVAAMRKLLHIAFGVLKNGKPFDPNYAN